ncbi:MAG: hypothetical protein JSV61_08295 [Anaerolineales bacterium]|nr:MAG: hypothetical protein JSV61_08295 [Anaerolineales bacterium]
MAKKSSLKIAVLVIGLISLAGCQMLSNNPTAAIAAVDANPVDARLGQKQLPAIQDEMILAGWNNLHSMQEPIQVGDGVLLSGQTLAQFLVESQIPVVWDSEGLCGGSSCSRQFCTLDGDCSFEDGQPGTDPIYLNDAIRVQSSGAMERLARELGHEAFHRMQFFGAGKITQIEEYWAFYLDTQLVKADYPGFDGVDPQDPERLAGWFTKHNMMSYLRLDPYPGVKNLVAQVEQGVVAAESIPIK